MSPRSHRTRLVDLPARLLRIAPAFLLLLLHPSTAVALVNPIKLFDENRQSVVRIVAVNTSGQMRIGCGIVLLETGTIATVRELFKDVAGVRVELADGTTYDNVAMLGSDGVVALLKIQTSRLRPLKLTDSKAFSNGVTRSVVILGGPAHTGRMLVGGDVTGWIRGDGPLTNTNGIVQLLLDAALFVENWGGPVFTEEGQVVGMISPRQRSAPGDTRHGVTPSNAIRDLMAKLTAAKTPGTVLPPLPPTTERGRQGAGPLRIESSRTINLFVAFGPDQLKSELRKELANSFPWEIVDSEADADLILLISAIQKTRTTYRVINGVSDVTPVDLSMRYEVSASLREKNTYNELWSSQKSVDATAATPYDQVSVRIASAMRKSLGTRTAVATPRAPQTVSTPPPPVTPSSVLTAADLPTGFQLLSPAEMEKLGMTAESQAALFRAWGEEAKVVGHAVFLDPRKPHFIIVSTMAPVSVLAAAGFHLEAAYPEAMIEELNGTQASSSGGEGPAVLVPGMDKFGDRSIGFTRIGTTGARQLREDTVLAIRGSTMEIVHSIYPKGSDPAIHIADIMKLVDAKVRGER